MRNAFLARRLQALVVAGLTTTGSVTTNAQAQPAEAATRLVSQVRELRQLAAPSAALAYRIRLEGSVWWANAAQRRLVLQDDFGAEVLEVDLPGSFPQTGQRIQLEGTGTLTRRGPAIRLGGLGPVVDNDGVHGMIEKSGTVYLGAGQHPIRVEWFNGVEGLGLEVEYSGPELPRQRIPRASLFQPRRDATGGTSNWLNGLEVRFYETSGEVLPDFATLEPIATRTADDFTVADLPRLEHVGAVFSGLLQVAQAGLYTFHLKSDDGSRLFAGQPAFRAVLVGEAVFPPLQRITVGQILAPEQDGRWSEVEGRVTLVRQTPGGSQLELTAGAGHLLVEIGNDTGLTVDTLRGARLRAIGFCKSVHTTDGQNVAGVLLVPGRREIEVIEPLDPLAPSLPQTNSTGLPVLTTAAEVHRLRREEAQRAYPVKIRGVVTCVLPEHQAFTLQDATRGIYIEDVSPNRSAAPLIGDFLEIEGTTDPSLFAPIIRARRIQSLGAGRLPEPVKPTWDQLINGSLDAQRVELQGIVTALHTNGLTLLTRGGIIRVELRLVDGPPLVLKSFENALVRIRGSLFASWDYVTHQVKMGDIRIYAADILLDQPAPEDLFSSPAKTAGELLLFDPQAGVFQRVKVSGQIVYQHSDEYFLMDGGRGLRFIPKQAMPLQLGDTVDVVGFPDLLGSASPVLREAVVRQTGHAAMPGAKTLTGDNLIHSDHDATLVRVEGLLVNLRRTKSDTVMELQSGVRTFLAHLDVADATVLSLSPGSRLELTGVYVGLGGNRAVGQDIAAFELLLHSPRDIRVLARPPWWTLKRLLIIVGALACVLAAAALWISQLHRQVEERTAQLGAQIQERQRIEHQRALEEERARIAQDLHDELGSGITEMSMLAARARSVAAPDERREQYLDHVGYKARELVTALDEIVWAMNPRHDSLASLVSYFSLYAERFLGLAGIAWRLDGPTGPADQVVESRRRHQLFLAFKEALTNVVRHSGATEVRIGIHAERRQVRMSIADNGRGLPAGVRTEDMDGVNNMRTRIEKLGGHFEITGEPGRGTTVRFDVPPNYQS